MRRFLPAVILGLAGITILISLGVWQLQRLAWKEDILSRIEDRIAAPPVALPAGPDPGTDRYLPVTLSGSTTGEELLVLSGQKQIGPGFEVIAAFQTAGGRRILLDRGFLPEAGRDAARPPVTLEVTGNLLWPQDADSYTPPPDRATGLWYARDAVAMAEALGTEPVLVVLRSATGDAQGISPVPVDTSGIPNDHLQYAITWFSLAGVWAGMTVYLLWRIRQKTF